jgi:outer membrane usher protein
MAIAAVLWAAGVTVAPHGAHARPSDGWHAKINRSDDRPGAGTSVPPPGEIDDTPSAIGTRGRSLYLEVFINGKTTRLIGSFIETAGGGLAAEVGEVREIGLTPEKGAIGPDGLVYLGRLGHVTYRVDEPAQRLYVSAGVKGREAKIIDVSRRRTMKLDEPRSGYGALVNYSLFASSNGFDSGFGDWLQGVGGDFEARFFSPYGTVSQTFLAHYGDDRADDLVRLNTTWMYSDPHRLLTYRAGDLITSGLSWTRPVYLGGGQVSRNFGLRRDLVTMPISSYAGTAAVPSTVEVYSRGLRTYSGQIADGPFELTHLPAVAGASNVRVVLRDSFGRETTAELPVYLSNQMLAPGLVDFSAAVGFPRRNFGLENLDYDDRPFGFATARYGATNWLTLEAHAEGGHGLFNGGIGATFPLSYYGVASLAGAGSWNDGEGGGLVNAGVQLMRNRWSLYGRYQRTFGDYQDVASVTSRPVPIGIERLEWVSLDPGVPKAIHQIGMSAPLIGRSNLGVSYADIEQAHGDRTQILSLSYSQPLSDVASFYASALVDLEDNSRFSVRAGLSMSFGSRVSASTWVQSGEDGTNVVAEASRSARSVDGDYGWRVRAAEGQTPYHSASGTYRSPWAQLEGGVQHYGDDVRATARVSGSVVAMPAGIFVANRIDDSFAIVDVGAPGVEVQLQNRTIGKTDDSGKKLVTGLVSYETNPISIDPRSLPIDADIPRTREIVVPAHRTGVVLDFGVRTATAAAIVALVDAAGKPLDVGLITRLDGGKDEFVIGYDGQVYVTGLAASNTLVVERKNGQSCRAAFAFEASRGNQVVVPGVVCR